MLNSEKKFADWMKLKRNIHDLAKMPTVNEGEIWWCAMGENVGIEVNGKSDRFSRPVLIVKKLSKYGFLGVPLTSKVKRGSWYVGFVFRGRAETAVLCQVRVMSVFRLYGKLGTVPNDDSERVKSGLCKLCG